MEEEGKGGALGAHLGQTRGHRSVDGAEILGTEVREPPSLEIAPEPFD